MKYDHKTTALLVFVVGLDRLADRRDGDIASISQVFLSDPEVMVGASHSINPFLIRMASDQAGVVVVSAQRYDARHFRYGSAFPVAADEVLVLYPGFHPPEFTAVNTVFVPLPAGGTLTA